jgi:hypothetical protein
MDSDEVMIVLLRDALAADVPKLSPTFDARVMRGIRPPRIAASLLGLLVLYALIATAVALWLMHDLPPTWIAAALGGCVLVAVGTSAYVRRLTVARSSW